MGDIDFTELRTRVPSQIPALITRFRKESKNIAGTSGIETVLPYNRKHIEAPLNEEIAEIFLHYLEHDNDGTRYYSFLKHPEWNPVRIWFFSGGRILFALRGHSPQWTSIDNWYLTDLRRAVREANSPEPLAKVDASDIKPDLDPQGYEYAYPDRILCAAIHFDDGKEHPHPPKNITSGFVVCGYRHCNCFAVASLVPDKDMRGVQGFLTIRGNFVDRKEGAKIALEAGQIKQETEILFSEDLY